MNRKQVHALCERFAGSVAEYPFGPGARVYKVAGKMFALVSEDEPTISLKCDPALAEILRERYADLTPGYHLNKRHWNTLAFDGTIPDAEVREMVEHSYDLIVKSMTKAQRDALAV